MTSQISSGTVPTLAVDSNQPTMEEAADPRKKGSRGGKRSVTHLSKAQLARKRANDREAQRNIRQRNKEHVGALERQIASLQKQEEEWEARVMELEEGLRKEYMQRLKMETENKMLRAQLGQPQQGVQAAQHTLQHVVQHPVQHTVQQDDQVLSVVQDEVLIPQKYPESWAVSPESMPVSTYPVTDQIYAATMAYDDTEASQQLYTTTADPMWDDTVGYTQVSQASIKPVQAWAPFQVNMAQPARYSYSPVDNAHLYANTTSWQTQPSPPAWQTGTKLKAPITHIDHLVMSIIEAQRQFISAGGQLSSHDIPPVQTLINQPSPARLSPKLAKIMAGYNSLLSNRGFALLPERLASFVNMYRFIQFLISPTETSFKALYAWQRPQPSQLTIPHPPWMDFPPWPKFRDKIIEAQDRYDNPEFLRDYASNLSINFPHDPMRAVVVVDGQIRISEFMARHLQNIENASMRKPFVEKYPEFRDACRFDEV